MTCLTWSRLHSAAQLHAASLLTCDPSSFCVTLLLSAPRCEDGSIRVWDAATWKLEAALAPGLQRIYAMAPIQHSFGWSHRCWIAAQRALLQFTGRLTLGLITSNA